MALTVSARGTGSNIDTGTTFTLSPESNLAAGSMAVLVISADNSNGRAFSTFTVTDSLGNTWSRKVRALGWVTPSANTGVEGAIFTTPMDGGTLITSTVITVTFNVSSAAEAWAMWEVVPASGMYAVHIAAGTNAVATTATPTVTTPSITSGNVLIGAGHAEWSDIWTGDADTTDGDWSAHQHTGVGAADATGMSVTTQAKITTGTGVQTYDPTLSSSVDCILSWIEIEESARPQRVNDRGTGYHGTSATTFTLSPESNLAAGSMAVLVISADNSNTDGTAFSTFTVTDSLGNTWSRRVSPLYDPGLANAGVEGAIFTTPMDGGTLITSTVITVTFNVATVGKAWAMWEVVPASGNTLAYVTGGVNTGSATNVPTVTTTSITSDNVVIGALHIENPSNTPPVGDADATNGSWAFEILSPDTGSAAQQLTVTQYKIVTATATQTYNPTMTAALDCILSWIEIEENYHANDTALAIGAGSLIATSTLTNRFALAALAGGGAIVPTTVAGILAQANIANAGAITFYGFRTRAVGGGTISVGNRTHRNIVAMVLSGGGLRALDTTGRLNTIALVDGGILTALDTMGLPATAEVGGGVGTAEALGAFERQSTALVSALGRLTDSTAPSYPEPPPDLVLVITDRYWTHLIESPNVLSLEIDEELGSAENQGMVRILATDPAAEYVPHPDSVEQIGSPRTPDPRNFEVYNGGDLVFAGLIDKATYRIDSEGVLSFGGIQRGGEMAERNFGRRDLLGWPLPELFRELLRDNIGRAPFATATASDSDAKFPPINAITGEPMPGQYWAPSSAAGSGETITIDLGSIQDIDAIRVIPEWTTGKWYTWTIHTSTDGSAYTLRYSYTQQIPTGDRGILIELGAIAARYVKLTSVSNSDGLPRIAGIMVYQNLAEVGPDTTYSVPWIENDDSGNVALAGATSRVIVDGAFAGDGILGNSFVTQLGAAGTMTHTFRGTSNAVYFTESAASTVDFHVDTVLQSADVAIPADSYQYKGFEITGLSAGQHTLKVTRKTGSPQVDYFSGEYQSSYRIMQEDATMIGYTGQWGTLYNDGFSSHAVRSSKVAGAMFQFPFYGDSLKARFTKGTDKGKVDWYMDGTLQGTVDLYSASTVFQSAAITWTGAYAAHTLRVVVRSDKNASSTGYETQLDSIEGNWAHIIYLRSAYDTNLSLIGRLSEMTNTFMRLNYDGTVDLLGAIGSDSGEIIREGENEGGNMEEGEVEGDWSTAVSAVLAIGRGTDNLALRVFVMDKPTVDRIGIKVAKIENRDVVDAYLLVRQAWQTLQDSKNPRRNYSMTWSDPE